MFFLGEYYPGETIYIPIATYGANNESITLTGLAVTDIEIYKNGSITQRASDNGYALLDTDGIDFDGITGIHGFSVDLSDNSTAGFYEAGSSYWVVVSSVTVNSQTVNLVYHFRIRLDIPQRGTLSGTHSSTTADLGTLAPANDISGQTLYFPGHKLSRVIDSYNTGTGVATFSPSVAVTLTNGDIWALFPSPPASTAAGAYAGLADAVWDEDATGHQTQGSFGQAIGDPGADTDTIFGLVNTNLNATVSSRASQTSVDDLPTNAELATALGTADDAVLAAIATVQSDTNDIQTRLPAALNNGCIPADVQRINDVEVVGAGTSGDKWRA